MKRALILDNNGEAVVTVNEEFDLITIMVGEQYTREGVIPSKKYQIKGIDIIKELHKFLSTVIQTNLFLQNSYKEVLDLEPIIKSSDVVKVNEAREQLRIINEKVKKAKQR